jgi:hypothetical protein
MSRADRIVLRHPTLTRRTALQAGAIGLLGLGMNHVQPLRAAAPAGSAGAPPKARSCIYIFLSGGLAQLDSFDLKPDAPAEIRGEFKPIATRSPGVQICEHLPRLAQRSHLWSLVRSLTHFSNSHTHGHLMMLTGRSEVPPGFQFGSEPKPTDWPSIASVAGYTAPRHNNNLPPAEAGQHGRHDLSRPGHPTHRRVPRRAGAPPPGLPRRAHRGVGLTPIATQAPGNLNAENGGRP